MKKRFLLLCLVCVIVLSSCASALREMEDDKILYAVDGDAVLLAKELKHYYANAVYEAEQNGRKAPSEKEAFLDLVQMKTLSYLAEKYGFTADRTLAEEEYRLYLEELADPLYAAEKAYADGLKDYLDMDEKAFMEYNIGVSLMHKQADALISGFAENYRHITDPQLLAEEIDKNLTEYLKTSEISCHYPGLKDYIPKFSYLYGTEDV